MINFKQYINESNIDKIKEECKKLNLDIDYSSDDWEEEFIDDVNWINISINKKLSEDFIKYFKDYVDWEYISKYQDLSESFIKKHEDDVYWGLISEYQELSESFIKRNKDKIYFNWLFDNKHISNELILNNIHWFINEDIYKNSWRLENKEFKDKWNKYKKLFGN